MPCIPNGRSVRKSWTAGGTTSCRSKRTNRRCWPIWKQLFPPLPLTGTDNHVLLAPTQHRALLRQTLPDAQLTIAQERPQKARHGRREQRTLWALASADLNAYVGSAGTVGEPWPGVAQVLRLERVIEKKERFHDQGKTTTEVVYAITSCRPAQSTAAGLLLRWRVHWHIENRLHWVRDVTFGEDASQIAAGQAPTVFAVLRNAAVTLLGWVDASPSLAAAQRDLAMAPATVPALFSTVARRIRGVGKK